ncbi:MAG: RluA family pseudouridine synthase [Candidatus Abyssubacteria bacterium]
MTEHRFGVVAEDEGARLDQYVSAKLPALSRARAQALIHAGSVLVNGRGAKSSHRVRKGETVRVSIEEGEASDLLPERIPLDIVHEDADIIVVNKRAGMVVHPAAGVGGGTLVNALLAHTRKLSPIGGPARPGIVHRLDKDTSGLLVVARSEAAHRALVEMIGRRAVGRRYRALAYGEFEETRGTIDAPIGRSPSDRKKMAVVGLGSREAKTHFKVEESVSGVSHLAVELTTGRTHQIRVHLAYIGHPVVGDRVYGVRLRRFHEHMAPEVVEAISQLRGHMLHAERLEFEHPVTGEKLKFTAPVPDEFRELLELLRKVSSPARAKRARQEG